MKKLFCILVFTASLLASELSLSLGIAKINAHEFSWDGDQMLSRLHYKSAAVPIFAIDFAKDFRFFRSAFSLEIGSGGGQKLIDDDWADGLLENDTFSPTRDPSLHTHRSIHDDLSVEQKFTLDARISTLPYALRSDLWASFGVGLRLDFVEFLARGGEYFYDCSPYPNACKSHGNFSDSPNITYSQSFVVPYFSLEFAYESPLATLEFGAFYSPITYAQDRDEHHLRDVLFETESFRMRAVGANFGVKKAINKRLNAGIRFDFAKYYQKRGNIYISGAEGYGVHEDGSSFDNESKKLRIYANFLF